MALWTVTVYNNFDVFNKTSFSYPGKMSIQMIDHLKFSRLRSLDHGTDLLFTKWLHLNTRLHEILDLQDIGSGISDLTFDRRLCSTQAYMRISDPPCRGFAALLLTSCFSYPTDCAVGQFKCGRGHCIPDFLTCDGNDDCGDLADEDISLCS